MLRFNKIILSVIICGITNLLWGNDEVWHFSLMYQQDECKIVDTERQLLHDRVAQSPLLTKHVHLEAIVFLGPERWTVWINHQRIDPLHPHPDIEIVNVTATAVNFRLRNSMRAALIQLGINQTIDLETIQFVDQQHTSVGNNTG